MAYNVFKYITKPCVAYLSYNNIQNFMPSLNITLGPILHTSIEECDSRSL